MSTLLKLTLADFEQMVEDGAFNWLRDRRIELIYGEIREMTPPGPSHSEAVSRLLRWSTDRTNAKQVVVRIQDPIGIPELDSQPQPDVVWAVAKSYQKAHPRPRDMHLVIEVADSSYDYDTGEKAEIYAQAGIKDYWVVNIPEFCIEVFRRPRRGVYLDRKEYPIGTLLAPLAFPRIKLSVGALFSGAM
jgi:Uma2 family endonuclease